MKRFTVIVLSVLIFSCTQHRNNVMLQSNLSDNELSNLPKAKMIEYRIKPADILFVKIVSSDAKSFDQFNLDIQGTAYQMFSDQSFYYTGYTVSDSGTIVLPVLGKIEVTGKTIPEIQQQIQLIANEYLRDALVLVKLANFNITVTGEVKRPGVYRIFYNTVTIFEGLSLAGDIEEFGNRKEVIVIRQNLNEQKILKLDLTDIHLLGQEGYYLLPNDIIYVKPLKVKNFRNNIPVISLFLSTLTTFLLISTYISRN